MSGTMNGATANGARRPQSLYGDLEEEKLSLKIDSLSSQQRTPGFVYVLTFFSALGGFLFGYDTGVISGAMIVLRDEFQLSLVWQEYIVSVTVAAAALFAPIGGFLNDRLGRRPVIMAASVVFTVGALCMAIAGDKYLLLAGRIVVGAGIGLTSTTIPMYLAECSPANERGRLVSTNIAMVACGQFVASVVDGIFGWCQYDVGWRYMLGLAGIPSFVQFLGFVFMPESPRWLIINEREEYARRVLQTMRGHFDIDEEFESIKNSYLEAQDGESTTPVFIKMLRTPAVRRALFVGCSLQLFQQLSGINSVMYYSATIIRMSGVRGDETTIWLSAFTAAVNFIFTVLGLFLVERIGRRALTLGSLIGAIVSLAWLAIGFQLSAMNTTPITLREQTATSSKCQTYLDCNSCMRDLNCGYCYIDSDNGPENGTCLRANYDEPFKAVAGRCNDTHLQGDLTWAYDYCPTKFYWMPMIGLVAYLIFFAPGMGPMPWTINSEIYPSWARSAGNAASTFTNWTVNLAMSMSFLSLTQALTRFGTFWLYSGLALIGLIVLVLFLPETKGKTLEEVEGLFARPWCGTGPKVDYNVENIQYVHIRGLNRDGRESEIDSPD